MPAPRSQGKEITQDARVWWQALADCLESLGKHINLKRIARIAVDGTSSTVLLCDAEGKPLAPALMYNDARADREAETIASVAGISSGAIGAGSSLAKVLWLLNNSETVGLAFIQHQADWISSKLTGRFGHSDYHNALKLGFDPEKEIWPDWIIELGINRSWLPRVQAPGEIYNTIQPELALQLGLSQQTRIVAGTTDSIAAFLASGARQTGDAVTSLGSTLVLKLLSDKPVVSRDHGVYSHRLADRWLVGGASNSGGGVLRKYFSDEEMAERMLQLRPDKPTGLDYYPLPGPGERFPINDPDLVSRIEPIPEDKTIFFQALLEGIARIEQRGYQLLEELGAPSVQQVFTAGGGAHNEAWSEIRHGLLGVPVKLARHSEAAFGSALLAAGQTGHLPAIQ
jgi:sugar (pentulose or hexulose) kinase